MVVVVYLCESCTHVTEFCINSLIVCILAILCSTGMGMSQGLFSMILRNLFCIIYVLLMCVLAAAAHTYMSICDNRSYTCFV